MMAGTLGGICLGILAIKFILSIGLRQRIQRWIVAISTSLMESASISRKIGWRGFFEANLRAAGGHAIHRPFGTSIHFFQLDRYQFNPVVFSRNPFAMDVPIRTEVTLGPLSKKPLSIQTPIMIGGMSYGSSLSFQAKLALARASALAGTAINTGSGPFLEETHKIAGKYVLQLPRSHWNRSVDIFHKVDMIEIALGHGAWGSSPVRISGKQVTSGFAKGIGAIPGLDVILESRLPEVETEGDLKALVGRLKELSNGVPIAIKLGGTHYIERELEFILEAGVDVVVIDGSEGGTHASPTVLADDVGLPTLPTLCRTARFFEEHSLKGKISLVIGGGLVTPGDFLKCLALGADAVILGTVACLAMSHTQVIKTIPWEPPTELIYYGAKKAAHFNPDLGAKHLSNFFQSCLEEMKLAARTLGKTSLREITRDDLVALDPLYADIAGVPYISPAEAQRRGEGRI
jgi:glutamate synthase domain-containing protein 2